MTTADSDNKKVLALGVNTAKFTAAELLKLIDKYLLDKENGILKPKQMTYDEFQHPGGVSLLNVSMEKQEMEAFTDTAERDGVNVSLKRNRESGTYYLTLQGQRQSIEKTLVDYRKMVRDKQNRQSLQVRLEQAKERAAAQQSRERGRTQEHTQERGGRS